MAASNASSSGAVKYDQDKKQTTSTTRTLSGSAAFGSSSSGGTVSSSRPSGSSSSGSSTGSSGYQQYTGGNAQMDAEIGQYKDKWDQAYAAGDVQGMIDANNAANQIRNDYGYAAENIDISGLPGYSDYASKGGGSSGGGLGSSSGGSSNVNDLSSYLEQMYQAQKDAAISQIKNAYEQNMAAIDKAKGEISPQYQSARNQTAGSAEQAARQFAEYAAASGLGSGTSAQAELSRNIALQNNLNQLNTEEANAYADLELQKSQAEIEYNNAIAQAEANNNAQLAAALYQEKVRVQNALIEQQNTLFQQAFSREQLDFQKQQAGISNQQWQQQFDYEKQQAELAQQQQNQKYLASWGESMLQNGVMPTDEMLNAMGLTSDQANAYISFIKSQLAAQQAASGTKSSGGYSGSSNKSGNSSSSGQTISAPSSPSQNTSYSVDMNSVLNLGYGPIDSNTLAELEAKGLITSYVDGNLIKFVKNNSASSGSSIFSAFPTLGF